jgi:hypothetical protein
MKKHMMFCEAAYASESTESENSKSFEIDDNKEEGIFDRIISIVCFSLIILNLLEFDAIHRNLSLTTKQY